MAFNKAAKMRLNIGAGIFGLLIGGGFIFYGCTTVYTTYSQVQRETHVQGVVSDTLTFADGKGYEQYLPIVSFRAMDGRVYQVSGDFKSGIAPKIGETKNVAYDPQNPKLALIDDFENLYLLPSIVIAFGGLAFVVFFLGPLLRYVYERRKIQRLMDNGRPIQAQLIGCAKTGVRLNRVPFFRVNAEWKDPATGVTHSFRSFPLLGNPSSYLTDKKEVTVYVNPANPSDYWMDTSFIDSDCQ